MSKLVNPLATILGILLAVAAIAFVYVVMAASIGLFAGIVWTAFQVVTGG